MNGFNRVFILGYLGADPERQTSRDGKSFVKLSVATHFNKRLDSGRRESSTVWHRVTVWGKSADNCQSYLQKGSALAIEGYLSHYNYVREDGTDTSASSIVAREVHFIGGRQSKKEVTTAPGPLDSAPVGESVGKISTDEFLTN